MQLVLPTRILLGHDELQRPRGPPAKHGPEVDCFRAMANIALRTQKRTTEIVFASTTLFFACKGSSK